MAGARRFKALNDALGHEGGQRLSVSMEVAARRASSGLPQAGFASRLSTCSAGFLLAQHSDGRPSQHAGP